jgi:hypothetical protein
LIDELFTILYFSIVHCNETNVSQCRYQSWIDALLLSDYKLTNQSQFLNKTILKFGAGIGLYSLIASRFSSNIICTGSLKLFPLTKSKTKLSFTDHNNHVLDVIKQNTEINAYFCEAIEYDIL